MSVPPVVQLESRLRREVPIPAGERIQVLARTRPGVAWEASWAPDGLAWSARTIAECVAAAHWSTADDGEGGLVVVLSKQANAAELAIRYRKKAAQSQVQVQPRQVWAARWAEGRTILITDPDDKGRVRYKMLTPARGRQPRRSGGRIQRQSLLSAYKLLPPGHPAYEAMRRNVTVRYPRQWETGISGSRATACFADPASLPALVAWLESESAWQAFLGWVVISEEA